ncbi:hypothetical protein [Enterococcus wangshanyuanii]|nr:hypothetical protein [Enterococcus wangshanyuanii]
MVDVVDGCHYKKAFVCEPQTMNDIKIAKRQRKRAKAKRIERTTVP